MHKQTLDATMGALMEAANGFLGHRTGEKPWSVAMAERIAGSYGEKADAMQSIFTHLNGEHPHLYLPTAPQDRILRLPTKTPQQDSSAVTGLREKMRCGLQQIQPTEAWIGGLLSLLEDCLSFIPSDEPDISAYDRAKITAALAACISEYLLEQGRTEIPKFEQEEAFLLYSADFSGIQKFIFTVATSKALASLRSRSFFLELLMEHYIDELLTACHLSRANLLYSGGGHCYLLLPNTAAAREAVTAWNLRFNDWLLDEFGVQLFVAHGFTSCSANDLKNIPAADAPYTAMFRRVSAAVAAHKVSRYSAAQIRRLNHTIAGINGRECVVCGRSDLLDENSRCPWCALFTSLSVKILTRPVYLVSRSPWDSDFSLPGWNGETYIAVLDEKTARTRMTGEAVVRMYVKNRSMELVPNMNRIYVGDYAASLQMEELATESTGIRRLAVCRMDVDDLGHAFVAGFRNTSQTDPVKRDRYLTISRTSAFSRQMSLFFKSYINPILETPCADGSKLSVTIVYSGGDDVFLVGAWDGVVEAAQRIRETFHAFTGGSLTISAGISMHADRFPIRQAAGQSAELESCAKGLPGKNALALFDPAGEHIYSWSEFHREVLGQKLALLRKFFEREDQERGNSFLYQLLEFLRQSGSDRINLARYAYLLARMEPRDKQKRELYREFSQTMYRWGLSERDRKQIITAIYLFVYMERKRG